MAQKPKRYLWIKQHLRLEMHLQKGRSIGSTTAPSRRDKYFGKDNVVKGRIALQEGLTQWFSGSNIEFIENKVESTVFNGGTAIQTCIFSIKVTPKSGGKPVINRGRSMVVYIMDKTSPTGWLSLREMAQEAPDKKE
jgi:hypothetical protein